MKLSKMILKVKSKLFMLVVIISFILGCGAVFYLNLKYPFLVQIFTTGMTKVEKIIYADKIILLHFLSIAILIFVYCVLLAFLVILHERRTNLKHIERMDKILSQRKLNTVEQ